MEALDIFAQIVGSPLFMTAVVSALVGLGGYAVLRSVRSRQRLVAFMRTHGFRWTDTESTLWLAHVVEHWGLLDICGFFDGRWVDVRSRVRRDRCITVTANRDLVSGQGTRPISIGARTRPKPPALLEGMYLEVSGRQLRVFVGGGDFVPYIVAAVAYARMLEERPVDPDADCTSG
jgi:hypothetical protein